MPQRGYVLQPNVAASATLGNETSMIINRNRVAVEDPIGCVFSSLDTCHWRTEGLATECHPYICFHSFEVELLLDCQAAPQTNQETQQPGWGLLYNYVSSGQSFHSGRRR